MKKIWTVICSFLFLYFLKSNTREGFDCEMLGRVHYYVYTLWNQYPIEIDFGPFGAEEIDTNEALSLAWEEDDDQYSDDEILSDDEIVYDGDDVWIEFEVIF